MERLKSILISCGAADAAIIKYSDCEIINARLAENLGFTPRSVIIGTIPYYTHYCDEAKSVSAYALAYDYHRLIKEIGESAVAESQRIFPDAHFRFFGDHSPIKEKKAAAKAGLGIIGAHSLLITPNHSSFVFLLEIITDLEYNTRSREIEYCENCGKCKEACPGFLSGNGECLSAITQKKGSLSHEEKLLIRDNKTVWGCDICQMVCPHTVKAIKSGSIYTNIKWFNTKVNKNPCAESINEEEDFKLRAYSWRGKDTILRNINILNEVDRDK